MSDTRLSEEEIQYALHRRERLARMTDAEHATEYALGVNGVATMIAAGLVWKDALAFRHLTELRLPEHTLKYSFVAEEDGYIETHAMWRVYDNRCRRFNDAVNFEKGDRIDVVDEINRLKSFDSRSTRP